MRNRLPVTHKKSAIPFHGITDSAENCWSIIHLLLFPISLGIFNGIGRIFNWPCGVLLLTMRLATLFIATPVGEPVDIH